MTETRPHNDQNPTTPITTIENPFVITVNGNGNNINLTTAQAAGSSGGGNRTGTELPEPTPEPPSSPSWNYSRRVGAFLVGAATVGASLAAIAPIIR
ncbi:hypothetical protein [Streptomyces sp. NPDC001274]